MSGHQHLDNPSAWLWVRMAIDDALERLDVPLIGVTSLAVGADQLFAETILRLGGAIEVVVPYAGYERAFESARDRRSYEQLVEQAIRVEVLPFQRSVEEAYLAAGQRVVDLSDMLLAVWTGEPAAGLGGTADIVAYARSHGTPVVQLNPTRKQVTTDGD